MKYKLFFLSLIAFFVSCSDADDINDVVPPQPDVILPQGGNAVADDSIQALYDRYDSYFLYRFTADDLNWTLVSGGLFDTQYRHTAISPDKVCNLLSAVREAWLNFYPEEFNRKYLPKYIYLAETLEAGDVSYSYVEEAFVTKWTPITSRYADNQIAIANVGGDWQTMDAAQRKAFKSSLQSVVLNYYAGKRAIPVPEAFYEVSSYEGSSMTASKARKEGFIINPATGKDWATLATQLTREEDIEAYLAGIAYYTSSEWRTVYSGNTNIRQKYDILMQALKDAGIKVDAMSTFR